MPRSAAALEAKFNRLKQALHRGAGLSFPRFTVREQRILLRPLIHIAPEKLPKRFRFESRLEQELLAALCISKTRFFRHPRELRYFRTQILSRIERGPFRILCAGCSSGEEAYTLAMLAQAEGFRDYKITGIDLDEQNVARAKRGFFPRTQVLREVPASYRTIGFLPQPKRGRRWLEVRRDILARLRIRRGNLFSLSSSGEKYDVIFCRNLLYYFNSEDTLRALTKLSGLCKSGAFLLVSPFDKIPSSPEWRKVAPCVYQRK